MLCNNEFKVPDRENKRGHGVLSASATWARLRPLNIRTSNEIRRLAVDRHFGGARLSHRKAGSPFVRARSAPGCATPRQPAGLTCPRQAGRSATRSLLSFFNYSVLFTDIKISGSAGRQAIGQSHAEFAPRYVRTRKGLFLPRFSTLPIHLPAVSYRHASTNFRFSSRVLPHFISSRSFSFYSGTWICWCATVKWNGRYQGVGEGPRIIFLIFRECVSRWDSAVVPWVDGTWYIPRGFLSGLALW